jgi:hypothetical protein
MVCAFLEAGLHALGRAALAKQAAYDFELARCVDVGNPAKSVTFETLSGPLKVSRTPDNVASEGDCDEVITLSMYLPLIYPSDPLPSCVNSPESALVKHLCQDLQVSSAHRGAHAASRIADSGNLFVDSAWKFGYSCYTT